MTKTGARAPRRGLLLVISSPSGAGKTSLCRRLVADYPQLRISISATTRAPRAGEQEGREYHFVDSAAFDAMVARGEFLEWAKVHEHRYGTPRAAVTEAVARGDDVLFDIDWQGAEAISGHAPADIVRVFILPPSMAELSDRLRRRAQDGAVAIARRLAGAKAEIGKWAKYDYVIVNENLDAAYATLEGVYRAERRRRARNLWLGPFVEGLLAEPV